MSPLITSCLWLAERPDVLGLIVDHDDVVGSLVDDELLDLALELVDNKLHTLPELLIKLTHRCHL